MKENVYSNLYETWQSGLKRYLELYEKGLKKQANQYIDHFIKELEHSLSNEDFDNILWEFCSELCEEERYTLLLNRGNGSLPYAIGRVVWKYLKQQCELEKMPQMRWIFQLFGTRYNPFNPNLEWDMLEILKKAYRHKDCDPKTVSLYFHEILEQLYWGAHHFPDCCIITKETYETIVETAEKILAEKEVPQEMIDTYEYYRKLYQEWEKRSKIL